mmetsp:Transcript_81910/g.144638  ORF Transcript_81910/g.144638 Transcript_81910/m.144638 type:complete len:232 (-) Transcript_81910:410-1105(-)
MCLLLIGLAQHVHEVQHWFRAVQPVFRYLGAALTWLLCSHLLGLPSLAAKLICCLVGGLAGGIDNRNFPWLANVDFVGLLHHAHQRQQESRKDWRFVCRGCLGQLVHNLLTPHTGNNILILGALCLSREQCTPDLQGVTQLMLLIMLHGLFHNIVWVHVDDGVNHINWFSKLSLRHCLLLCDRNCLRNRNRRSNLVNDGSLNLLWLHAAMHHVHRGGLRVVHLFIFRLCIF